MFYNCHTHVFNAKSIPENFLGRGLIRLLSRTQLSFLFVYYLKKLSRWVANTLGKIPGLGSVMGTHAQWVSKLNTWLRKYRITRWLANIFQWFADTPTDFLAKYAFFAEAGREKSQELIFEKLRKTPCYSEDTRFIVLPLNMDHMGAGKPRINYLTQLAFIDRLKKKYPQQLLPFVCVDPRSMEPDAMKKFVQERIENMGYVGIKFYPALGFYPFDPRLNGIYQYAVDNRIPIMTHCTKGGVFYKGALTADQLHPRDLDNSFVDPRFIDTSDLRNSAFKNNFTDPAHYTTVFEKYPKLKLCFAHFGGSSQLLQYKNTKDQNTWYYKIKVLMQQYENIYTDVSYTLAESRVFDMLRSDIESDEFGGKILFGTDFYMTEQEKPENDLVNDFRKILDEQLFSKIAKDNPEKYLASEFFMKKEVVVAAMA